MTNADGDRLFIRSFPNFDFLPVLVREAHGRGNVLDGHHRVRGQEPAGAAYAQHAGTRLLLFVIEIAGDAHRGVSKRCGIDARRLDT